MQPRFESRGAFRVVGVRQRHLQGKPDGIGEQWGRFCERLGEIDGAVEGANYGVCEDDRAAPKEAPAFFYSAAAEVRGDAPAPDGLAAVEIPAARYAVFTHTGPVTELHGTVRKVWSEWIPASGVKPTGGPDFELYDERFKMDEPDSVIEIWVPVEG